MSDLLATLFPYKVVSLMILALLLVVWLWKTQTSRRVSGWVSGVVMLCGSLIILRYPAGDFACDVCGIVYWTPAMLLPCIIFFGALVIIHFVSRINSKLK